MKKKIVVFTGAGISAESGIATFRDSDGLWANYKIEEVCTPEALIENRPQVIDFYNHRRKEVMEKQPNEAHKALKKLEDYFHVEIITQNIDDLHERAGSTRITHLHGEIKKLCSSLNVSKTLEINNWEQDLEARHEDGSLLRPFVVFFGEQVPMLETAIKITQSADIFIVIGTSLNVYPAASLLHYVNINTPVYVVDPHIPEVHIKNKTYLFEETASAGVKKVVEKIINFTIFVDD